MISTLTATLQGPTTPPQCQALRRTPLACRGALNCVRRYAVAPGKLSTMVDVQVGSYQDVRTRVGWPAQIACSVPRPVGVTDKTRRAKGTANAAARAVG